jgi:hypothetical protein
MIDQLSYSKNMRTNTTHTGTPWHVESALTMANAPQHTISARNTHPAALRTRAAQRGLRMHNSRIQPVNVGLRHITETHVAGALGPGQSRPPRTPHVTTAPDPSAATFSKCSIPAPS